MRTKKQKHDSYSGFIGANGGAPAAPVNTVAPTITGTATVGQTLTGANGTWTGKETPVLTRQWRRGGVAISGATAATYLLAAPDVGAAITFAVTGTNWAGAVVGVSTATAAVGA